MCGATATVHLLPSSAIVLSAKNAMTSCQVAGVANTVTRSRIGSLVSGSAGTTRYRPTAFNSLTLIVMKNRSMLCATKAMAYQPSILWSIEPKKRLLSVKHSSMVATGARHQRRARQ